MSLKVFSVLKLLLWLQLSLLIIRQVIDFCGIQWLMIFVNFLSILITISALFHYFLLYFLFQFLLIFYNFFVIFCYLELISAKYENLLSFDSNSKSFFFQLIPNYVNLNETELKSCVKTVECIQSVIHCVLSLLLVLLLLLFFHKRRQKQRQQNSKTTPPLPPYTISPIPNNAFISSQTTQRSLRRSKRRPNSRRSSQRSRKQSKLITSSVYYSDSETDFYGVGRQVSGLTNPLYCSPHYNCENETRI